MSPASRLRFFTTNTNWEIHWLVRRVQNETETSLYDFLGLTWRLRISSGWEDGCVSPESSASCACILLSLKSVLKISEAYLYCVCAVVSRSFATPWTVARHAPLSMGFPRQEYWSGLPFPSLGDLPNPGIKPVSLGSPALTGGFFINWATWETICYCKRPLLQKSSERL